MQRPASTRKGVHVGRKGWEDRDNSEAAGK